MKTTDIAITPVKKYAPPKYPTIESAKNDPDLLLKLPSRWEKNATVVVALGMIGVMALTSCGFFEPKIKGYNPNSENYLNVAPVFIHGKGTGAYGGDFPATAVILTEEDALAIIKSMAKDAGLKFRDTPPKYITKMNEIGSTTVGRKDYKIIFGNGNIGLDLYDNKKGVAVTYISREEALKYFLDTENGNIMMAEYGGDYHSQEVAEFVVEDFAQQKGDITVGVFYEPSISWEIDNYQEENLRAQVRDFIEWLQAQGII